MQTFCHPNGLWSTPKAQGLKVRQQQNVFRDSDGLTKIPSGLPSLPEYKKGLQSHTPVATKNAAAESKVSSFSTTNPKPCSAICKQKSPTFLKGISLMELLSSCPFKRGLRELAPKAQCCNWAAVNPPSNWNQANSGSLFRHICSGERQWPVHEHLKLMLERHLPTAIDM